MVSGSRHTLIHGVKIRDSNEVAIGELSRGFGK
jgi:hypothetical protein